MRILATGLLSAVLALVCASATAAVQADETVVDGLKKLSLEELMAVDVSTASRLAEPLFETPAAVFVITGDDIRRSGVRSIAEALRLAPGVEVARRNAHAWSITLRGFNSDLANKLLVLIDGRSVYSPLFAGVFWDVQDTLLEDIERIEVIAGPGGTLWGANAVNGVINIITRSAADDARRRVRRVGGGNEERCSRRPLRRHVRRRLRGTRLRQVRRARPRLAGPTAATASTSAHMAQAGLPPRLGAPSDDDLDGPGRRLPRRRTGTCSTETSRSEPCPAAASRAKTDLAARNVLGALGSNARRRRRLLAAGSTSTTRAATSRTPTTSAATRSTSTFSTARAGPRHDLLVGRWLR